VRNDRGKYVRARRGDIFIRLGIRGGALSAHGVQRAPNVVMGQFINKFICMGEGEGISPLT